MKGTRVRAFMPKNFWRPKKLAAFIKMEQFYGQPGREPLRNGKRSGQKQSFCKMVKNPAIKYGSRMASAVARFIESRIGLFKTRWAVNDGEHLAETPQITGGNSALRMGERHRMISAYDNAVRTGEQPLMTKSVILRAKKS